LNNQVPVKKFEITLMIKKISIKLFELQTILIEFVVVLEDEDVIVWPNEYMGWKSRWSHRLA